MRKRISPKPLIPESRISQPTGWVWQAIADPTFLLSAMPYLFEFDSSHRVLRCTMSGPVTDAILNFTQVSSIEISSVTIRNLAASSPSPQCASLPQFIVAPSDYGYGMARMFQLWGRQVRPELQVVRSLAEAYEAIGLEEPHFEPIPEN